MTEPRLTISDYIAQLIRPRKHTATYTTDDGQRRTHSLTHPPLLDELQHNTTTAKAGASADYTHGDARSKPAGRLDAVALLQRIDRQADSIAKTIGSRRIGTLAQRLSSISGTIADHDPDTTAWALSKVRGWVIGAQVITGWDVPPYVPDVPCGVEDCEKRGSIRIRLEEQVAYCVECGTHWGPEQINQLGRYVAWASEHLRGARHWLTDDEGYPIECTECLATREEMAARTIARATAKANEDTRATA